MDVRKRGLIYKRAIGKKTREIGWNQPLILNHLFLPEPTWMSTPHILEMAFDISKLIEYRLFAPSESLPGCVGYWHVDLWRQNFPYVCIMYSLRRLAITGSSTSKRLALAKISFLSVTFSFDKWIKKRWLSIESRHWGKLNKLETPRESPHEVSEERDRTQNILLRITLQVFNVINPKIYQ